jgi:hypothetical protein
MNYNSGYNNDENYGEYNQFDAENMQTGNLAKTLPVPPSSMAASQSACDGFGIR